MECYQSLLTILRVLYSASDPVVIGYRSTTATGLTPEVWNKIAKSDHAQQFLTRRSVFN